MHRFKFICVNAFAIQVLFALGPFVASAQEQKKVQETVRPEASDVLRINIELVQTDVMVFDKQGHFVDGLRAEQFELEVDGKRQPISFFESVRTGSDKEEAQLIAARGRSRTQSPAGVAITSFPGRTILFFIDDLHVTPGSIARIRKSLLGFIDQKLAENDQAAITSASGRIGFLQQLTDNKAVLRAAVERITYGAALGRDFENPPMGEYAALLIAERHDKQLFDYFVQQTVKVTHLPADIAEKIVERRAAFIVRNSDTTNKLTFTTLGNLMQSIIKVPGRKLVFFMSEGFVPNYGGSDITDALHRATEAADAAGVVVYSIDPRGLATGSWLDASSAGGFDSYGVLMSRLSTELSAQQEPLHAVASATGGRALLNSNALDASITKALNETSSYYLLAWRPESMDNQRLKSSKIKVTIAGRPDLEVKLRRGYLGASLPNKTKAKAAGTIEPDNEILTDNVAPTRGGELPTSLFVGYKRSSSNSAQLVAFIAVGDGRPYVDSPKKPINEAQVVGAVFDSRGKAVGAFKRAVVIRKTKANGDSAVSNYQVNVPPGLYQVRVFAREKQTGRLGAAQQWIEIQDAKDGQLSISSLYLGEITEGMEGRLDDAEQVATSVSRRFAQASLLRFTAYIYGSSHAQLPPELSVQTRIFRGAQSLVTTPERKVTTAALTSFATIPYSAQFSLNRLPAGRYTLKILVTDHITKSTATQQADFIVY